MVFEMNEVAEYSDAHWEKVTIVGRTADMATYFVRFHEDGIILSVDVTGLRKLNADNA